MAFKKKEMGNVKRFSTHCAFREDVVEDPVRYELQPIRASEVVMQRLELRLALVKLFVVSSFKSQSSVRLVNFNRKPVPYPLHSEILTNRLHLIAAPPIIWIGYPR